MRQSARRRGRPKGRERADRMPESIDEWIDMWFSALPYDALLVIEENGVVIGTVHKQEVDSRGFPDLYLFLMESAEFGCGNYRIAASYNGAFRGEHLRCEVGEPEQWRRGNSRAETRAIVDAERARRERAEAYERDPMGTARKEVAEILSRWSEVPRHVAWDWNKHLPRGRARSCCARRALPWRPPEPRVSPNFWRPT